MKQTGPKKHIWKSDKYYEYAKEGSLDTKHPGMKILKDLAENANKILDMGCGEGTRLDLLIKGKTKGFGVDISSKAIVLARKKYHQCNFKVASLEKIPYKDNYFDLVYCAYVLEHLENPEEVIDEGIRVTKKNGRMVFIAPNYGSPNRASPAFKESRVKKFFMGFIADLFKMSTKSKILEWHKVDPELNIANYQLDADTIREPYIKTLLNYLNLSGLIIELSDSCWDQELANAKFHQRIFRFLGEKGLYPFIYWGPHLVILAKKHG